MQARSVRCGAWALGSGRAVALGAGRAQRLNGFKRKGILDPVLTNAGAHQAREVGAAAQGLAEVDAHEVGLAILGPLRELDEVAYLRFASVYQAFDSLEDFESAITILRAEREATGVEPSTTH